MYYKILNGHLFLDLWSRPSHRPDCDGFVLTFKNPGRPGEQTLLAARACGEKNNPRRSSWEAAICFRDGVVDVMEHHGASFIFKMEVGDDANLETGLCLSQNMIVADRTTS